MNQAGKRGEATVPTTGTASRQVGEKEQELPPLPPPLLLMLKASTRVGGGVRALEGEAGRQ